MVRFRRQFELDQAVVQPPAATSCTPMKDEIKPHPRNVPGDFYVEDGCCTLCDIPRTEAPELFALTEHEDHCFVRRQPQTEDETNRMLSAIACAELPCIHYRGHDPAIISCLAAMGEMDICDTVPPVGTELGLRSHVTFACTPYKDLSGLAASFKTFLSTHRGKYARITFPSRAGSSTTVKYKRNDEGWHLVNFDKQDDFVHVWHESHRATSVSWYISRWISSLEHAADIRWYTNDAWNHTGKWHRSHWPVRR